MLTPVKLSTIEALDGLSLEPLTCAIICVQLAQSMIKFVCRSIQYDRDRLSEIWRSLAKIF